MFFVERHISATYLIVDIKLAVTSELFRDYFGLSLPRVPSIARTSMSNARTKSYALNKIPLKRDLEILDSCILGHIKAVVRQSRLVTTLYRNNSAGEVFPRPEAAKREHNSQKNTEIVKIATS